MCYYYQAIVSPHYAEPVEESEEESDVELVDEEEIEKMNGQQVQVGRAGPSSSTVVQGEQEEETSQEEAGFFSSFFRAPFFFRRPEGSHYLSSSLRRLHRPPIELNHCWLIQHTCSESGKKEEETSKESAGFFSGFWATKEPSDSESDIEETEIKLDD